MSDGEIGEVRLTGLAVADGHELDRVSVLGLAVTDGNGGSRDGAVVTEFVPTVKEVACVCGWVGKTAPDGDVVATFNAHVKRAETAPLDEAAAQLQRVVDDLRASGFRVYGNAEGALFVAPWGSVQHRRVVVDPHLRANREVGA